MTRFPPRNPFLPSPRPKGRGVRANSSKDSVERAGPRASDLLLQTEGYDARGEDSTQEGESVVRNQSSYVFSPERGTLQLSAA